MRERFLSRRHEIRLLPAPCPVSQDGEPMGHSPRCVFLPGNNPDSLRVGGLSEVQHHPGHHGLRTRALLRANRWVADVLRHDFHHGGQAHPGHVLAGEGRARPVAVDLLRRHVYQDEPHLQDLQPRREGDGEKTELHESPISAHYLPVSGLGANHRRHHVDGDGRSRCAQRLPGPQDGHTPM